MIKNIIKLSQRALVELNLFTARDVGSNVDQMTSKRYGQLATRLYLILFLTGLIIIVLYTVIQPHIVTKNFEKPSFDFYNHLRSIYGEKLTCSCSIIASTFNQFVKIQSVFHSVS